MHRVNLWSQGQAVFGTVAKDGRMDYCESVVKLSHISFCTKSSVANMFYRISCSNITLHNCHVKCCKYVFWGVSQKCHSCKYATVTKKTHPPPMESQRPHQWKARGPTSGKPEALPMESQRPYRWKARGPTDGKPEALPMESQRPPAKLAIDRTEGIMYGDSSN
jgi:hypothetical protein